MHICDLKPLLSTHQRLSYCQIFVLSIKKLDSNMSCKTDFKHLTLTYDSKVKAFIWNFYCNLHVMGNHGAKYENSLSKTKRDVGIISHRQVSDIFDLDSKVISYYQEIHCYHHSIGNHFAKYEHPRSKDERLRGSRSSGPRIYYL